jgi:hypothetical protein
MTTQELRDFVRREYIEPARRMKRKTVTVKAGEVHKRVRLHNRIPLVCQALSSKKFLEENHLQLEHREGPQSGLSTTSAFTYRLDSQQKRRAKEELPTFVTMRGIGKEVFASLGGGEAFIRKERESFYGDERDQ